jgi:hypothetical protein
VMWSAGGGQLGLVTVSLLHGLSYSRPLFSSISVIFLDFFLLNIMGREVEGLDKNIKAQRNL